jgi:transposase
VPAYRSRPAAVSKLEPFKPYLNERMQAGVWNAQVLLRELRERNYAGGYTILKDWLKPQRKSAQVVAVRRFETPPGKHYGKFRVMVRSGAVPIFSAEISAASVT